MTDHHYIPPTHWPKQLMLCILVALASILIWEAFIDGPDAANAQSPKATLATSQALSSTTLLQELITAQKETNAKLDTVTKLLESGKVKVQVVDKEKPEPADKTPGKSR
jgi:hypothetical protein